MVEAEAETDHEQAQGEGADAPAPPAPPVCQACGREQDRFPTGYRHWILLEPRIDPAAHGIPEGQRWVVGGDGMAVNWVGGRLPPTCRIAHRPVCGRSPRPEHLPRIFLAVWELNASYERRIYQQDALPFTSEAETSGGPGTQSSPARDPG
ncbi:DUF6083 domain-containing protein [Streptomyces sp. Ac-502]|uniref:DUF6083 domain-containing protein n=1 Tax=Streptomyces sp. Ac-502 TaxID=3342801 RepID=UPI0038624D00